MVGRMVGGLQNMAAAGTPEGADHFAAGDHVRLRPLQQTDYPMLYQIEQDPTTAQQYRHRSNSIPPERYGEQLWAGVISQFVVEANHDAQLVGLVSLYSADDVNGHARMALIMRPDLRGQAWPMEGVTLFVDHVFAAFPYRKIYAEVTESAYSQFATGAGRVFDVEGQLVEHQWTGGSYEDMYVLAIHRQKWADRFELRPKPLLDILAEEAGIERTTDPSNADSRKTSATDSGATPDA